MKHRFATLFTLFSVTTAIPSIPLDPNHLTPRNELPNPYPDCQKFRSSPQDHCYAGMRTHPSKNTATTSIFDWHCNLLATQEVSGGKTTSIVSSLPGVLNATPKAGQFIDELTIEYPIGVTWGAEDAQNKDGSWWWEPEDGEGSGWGLVRFSCPDVGTVAAGSTKIKAKAEHPVAAQHRYARASMSTGPPEPRSDDWGSERAWLLADGGI